MFIEKITETGRQHGTWKVLGEVDRRWSKAHWELQCVECGYQRIIDGTRLRRKAPGCPSCTKTQQAKRIANHGGRRCGCGALVAVRQWGENDEPLSYRTQCRPCINVTNRAREAEVKANVVPVDCEQSPTLSTEPIARWLRPYLGVYDVGLIAYRCGIDPTGLNRIMKGEYSRAKLDTVDKILCGMDAPGTLRELYPEIYEFTAEQMREAEEWAHAA